MKEIYKGKKRKGIDAYNYAVSAKEKGGQAEYNRTP